MGTETQKSTIDDVLHDAADVNEARRELKEAQALQKAKFNELKSADERVAKAQAKFDSESAKFIKTFKEML